MNTHGIFIGRFQPVTKAHENIINKIGNENKVATIFLIKGKESSKNKEINPFDTKIQKIMLDSIKPTNVDVKILPTAFFVDEINTYSDDNFILYAGSDRIKSYDRFKSYMEDGKVLDTKEIKRSDCDISASKVRESLLNDDKTTFNRMTPIKIHKMYNTLRDEII